MAAMQFMMGLGSFLLLMIVHSTDAVLLMGSCKAIKDEDASAPSGIYTIVASGGRSIEVYCEMGLNGGGYTYLHPSSLVSATAEEVSALFTDKTSFLLRVRLTNGTQPYAVLSQLPEYAKIPLKLGLNEHTDYRPPVNLNIIGRPFLYFGFLPVANASNNNIQGISVNGVRVTFRNGDRNPNSQFTLFPNFREVLSSTYYTPSLPFCYNVFAQVKPNPSDRAMPIDMFMFGELHFGGGGCYMQTNRLPNILSFAIGFR